MASARRKSQFPLLSKNYILANIFNPPGAKAGRFNPSPNPGSLLKVEAIGFYIKIGVIRLAIRQLSINHGAAFFLKLAPQLREKGKLGNI